MSDMMRRRREQRREFLMRLYERVDGSVTEFVDANEIGAAMQMDEAETRRMFEYLEEKAWVLVDDHRGAVLRLTAAGVDAVEADA